MSDCIVSFWDPEYQDLPATFWQFCECREACLSYQGAIVELLSGEVRIVPAEHVTFI
jgi:hypothetical protein